MLLPFPGAAQTWIQQVRDENMHCFVFIDTKARYENNLEDAISGTGFIIHPSGYLLTCNHVVPAEGTAYKGRVYKHVESTGTVGARYGLKYPLTVIRRDEQADLVLLKLPSGPEPWRSVPRASETSLGSDVVAFGFPLAKELLSAGDSITGIDDDGRWLTDANLAHGMSGGPVFDRSGEVIGIAVAGYEDAKSLNRLIPISFASSLLQVAHSALLSTAAAHQESASATPASSPAKEDSFVTSLNLKASSYLSDLDSVIE
jgi:serine protease Do